MNPQVWKRILDETFVAHLEYFPVLGSTNDRAREAALGVDCAAESSSASSPQKRLPLPWLVLADRQTAGRGRGRNRWWTGPGSLAMSLLLPPLSVSASSPTDQAAAKSAVPESYPGLIGLGAALAVLRTVQPRLPGISVGLHWPNDVFASGKKLAGILVEVLGSGLVIVGIGVNTNNTAQEAPEELRDRVATLKDLTGQTHNAVDFLIELLQHLQTVWETLARSAEKVASEAHQECLQKGRRLQVQTSQEILEGICEGIGPTGELLLRCSRELCRIYSGTIVE